VDGQTLTHSFLDGLEAGVVDVPLVISKKSGREGGRDDVEGK